MLRNNKGNSLAEFTVTLALMATLATTASPAFSRIGEGAKAKQTKRNLDKIVRASEIWYNQQVELYGMGRFPSQDQREQHLYLSGVILLFYTYSIMIQLGVLIKKVIISLLLSVVLALVII